MNREARRYQFAISAAVAAAFGGFWIIMWAVSEPPEFPAQYVLTALAITILGTPWVIASRILFRDWWIRSVTGLTAIDAPALMLRAAVTTLPENRHEWGAAMETELTQAVGSAPRWRFALGCAHTALIPPRSNRTPLIVAAAISIVSVAVAAPAVGYVLPAMQIFAVTFVALVGVVVMFTLARSRRITHSVASTLVNVAGVVTCVGLTAYFLHTHSDASAQFSPAVSIFLAIMLSACVWISLNANSNRVALAVGLSAACVFGLGYFIASRMTVNTNAGPLIWIIFAPHAIFFTASMIATAATRSFGAGVQTAMCSAPAGTLLIFAISLPEAMRRYAIDGRLLSDGEST